MPRVRHLVDWAGSPDGNTVWRFKRGEENDLPARLYEVATSEGWAEPIEAKARPAPENKARAAPEIKHVGGGIYELPDGRRVRGREAAEAEASE